MEENLEYIDAYFQRTLDAEEVKRFEQRIAEDPQFADDVAFYLAAKQSIKADAEREKKETFRQLLAGQSLTIDIDSNKNVRRLWMYRIATAAAVIACLLFAWYLFLANSASPRQLADDYISHELKIQAVKMSAETDSIQRGLQLYNDGRYDSALVIFEALSQRDSSSYLAKEYAGIAYLQLGNYEKALQYFRQFENDVLYSNPSLFYQAVTLLRRDLPGDKEQAKELLQRVVDDKLEGQETARRWLKKW